VLSDNEGELIGPIVRGSRPGMQAIDMTDADVRAVAVYIHEIKRSARGQGAPPTIGVPVDENAIAGGAAAGKAYFDAKCAGCHSVTGDLQNIGNRMPTVRALQNLWVAGGGGRGRGGRGGGADRRTPTVTVTRPGAERLEGALVNIDDFTVTLALADGRPRTVRRDAQTTVEVSDPLQGHRDLLGVLTDKDMHDVTAYLVTVK
jgi:cytochrome c oxidase cbb3-type subunit 3